MESSDREAADEAGRVARVLSELKAGVRQRQAELASLGFDAGGDDARLSEVRCLATLVEPPCVSPRPVVGRALVAMRRGFFHLFVRWHSQPLVEQQSELNRSLVRVLAQALAELARERRRSEQLERRLAILERRIERAEGRMGVEVPEAPEAPEVIRGRSEG